MNTWFLLGLQVAALAISVSGCSYKSVPVVTKPTPSQVNEFVRNARLTLPPSAQCIAWSEFRGMDSSLWLQVQLPASDLDPFLASPPFAGAKFSVNTNDRFRDFQKFWQNPPVRNRSAQVALPNARWLNILIDDSNAASAVVYLNWHET